MPQITLQASYKKNSGLVISAEELLARYFYGLNIKSTDGTIFSNVDIESYIQSAQNSVERWFDIIFSPCLIDEKLDYYRDDYENGFPFFRTSHPVRTIKNLIGILNGTEQIKYPELWLQCRSSSKNRYFRQFSIVPNGSTAQADANVILVGTFSQYGIRSFPHVANYWTVQYESGYSIGQIPSELINLVGLISSLPLLALAGDIVLPTPGAASLSLSLDGLSNSVSSKNSAYSERIKIYNEQIESTAKQLKNTFKGISFSAC